MNTQEIQTLFTYNDWANRRIMMQHLVNHSTYHRGQVVTLLRHLGHTPPATDFLVFLDEAGFPS